MNGDIALRDYEDKAAELKNGVKPDPAQTVNDKDEDFNVGELGVAVFFDGATPAGVSELVMTQARYQATMAGRMEGVGDLNLGGNGGSITNGMAKAEQEEKKKEEFAERVAYMFGGDPDMLSINDIDAMDWEIDPNTMLTVNGQQYRAIDVYEAGRQTLNNLPDIAKQNGWSKEKQEQEERLVMLAMMAAKRGDQEEVDRLRRQMDDQTRADYDASMDDKAALGVQVRAEPLSASENIISTDHITEPFNEKAMGFTEKPTMQVDAKPVASAKGLDLGVL